MNTKIQKVCQKSNKSSNSFYILRFTIKFHTISLENCLEGNTMSNRGAYSTKERMPSDRKQPFPIPAWKAVHDWSSCTKFRDVLPSRQYKDYGLISPHILVSLVCTGLLIVLPSRQFETLETQIYKTLIGTLIFRLLPPCGQWLFDKSLCFPCSEKH